MRYAIRYRKDFRHFDTVDEVIFVVNEGNEKIASFPQTVVKSNWQKIILDIRTELLLEDIIPFILQLKEQHPNILIQIPFPFDEKDIEILKENKVPFMASLGFCKSLDMVYTMKEAGCAEIYVVEGLGFRLDEVHKILKRTGIKVRVIPNVTQCAMGTRAWLPAEHKFWIRPEDTRFYEPYVDIFEIFNEDDRLSVVYEIYKQQVWKGDLSEIILDAEDLNVSNDAVPPYFGDARINCRQRCFFGSCAACEANLQFARIFSKTDYGITYPKLVTTRGDEI